MWKLYINFSNVGICLNYSNIRIYSDRKYNPFRVQIYNNVSFPSKIVCFDHSKKFLSSSNNKYEHNNTLKSFELLHFLLFLQMFVSPETIKNSPGITRITLSFFFHISHISFIFVCFFFLFREKFLYDFTSLRSFHLNKSGILKKTYYTFRDLRTENVCE